MHSTSRSAIILVCALILAACSDDAATDEQTSTDRFGDGAPAPRRTIAGLPLGAPAGCGDS